MKRLLPFVILVAAGTVPALAAPDSVEKKYAARMERLNASYEKARDKLINDMLRDYDVLLKRKMREGELKEANEIKEKIDRLRGEKSSPDKDEPWAVKVGGDAGPAVPQKPKSLFTGTKRSERKHKKRVEERYEAFHEALIEEDLDKAEEFLDPQIREHASPAVIKGHLKLVLGVLKGFRMTKSDVDARKVVVSDSQKAAKVTGRFRVLGTWKDQDPHYWVLRDHEWYIGDDKVLVREFEDK